VVVAAGYFVVSGTMAGSDLLNRARRSSDHRAERDSRVS